MRYLALSCLLLLFGCSGTTSKPLKKTQILRTCTSSDVNSFDPRRGTFMYVQAINRMMFVGLVRLDSNLVPQLELAESYTVSPDFKTYTFALKKCFWSDGSPITAHDFERTWKEALSPAFTGLNTNLFFFLKNGKKASQDPALVDQLGVFALDDRTLKIELEKPNTNFLNVLINSVFSPVHKTMTSKKFDDSIVCSGPFCLQKCIFQDRTVLRKNPYYWNTSEVQLDEIHYYIVEDATTALLMFEQGKLDWLGHPLIKLPSDAIANLQTKAPLAYSAISGTQWIFLNTTKPPLNNRNIRLALSYAIDRSNIQRDILHFEPTMPTAGLIPKILKKEQWHPSFPENSSQQARALFAKGLEELGMTIEQFPPLKISLSFSQDNQRVVLAIQDMWEKTLGIKASSEALDGALFASQCADNQLDLTFIGWVMQYNHPISLLDLFKKPNAMNRTGWKSGAFNQYAKACSKAEDSQKQWDNIEAAEKIFIDDMPAIPVAPIVSYYLIKPHVKNLAPSPLLHLDFDRAFILIDRAETQSF